MADPSKPLLDLDTSGIASAVALAKASNIAVVAVGDRAGLFATGTVGEGGPHVVINNEHGGIELRKGSAVAEAPAMPRVPKIPAVPQVPKVPVPTEN